MSQYVTTPDGQRHKFPDGTTPEQMQAALASYAPQADSGPPMAMTPQNNPLMSLFQQAKGRALEALPTVGGLAGGAVGAALGGGIPGAMAGAGIGGAAGGAASQALVGEKLSPEGIAYAGGEQALLEGAGGLMARGASMAARPIMKGALRATKSVQSQFPDVVETVLERRLPVNRAGAAKASGLRRESSAALNRLLSGAEAAGTKFKTVDVADDILKVLKSPVLPNKEKAAIAKQALEFAEQHGTEIDPVKLKQIKRFYQNRASSLYKADAGALTLAQENRGVFSKAMASGAQKQLETIPGVAAQEAETKSLIGAQRAIENATMRHNNTKFNVLEPVSYPVIRVLDSPNVQSHLALLLSDPKFAMTLRQSPRAAAALLHQMLYSPAESDATAQP